MKNWKPKAVNTLGVVPISALDKTGTQIRVAINEDTVANYAELISIGGNFPPPVVFWDGESPIVGDGFHRIEATLRAKQTSIECDIKEGTRRDAIIWALFANRSHGLPLSNDDKRKAVGMLLDDAEWSEWSDSHIAREVGCSHEFVRKLRKGMESSLATVASEKPKPSRTYTTKHGTKAKMDTAAIGQKPKLSAPPKAPAEPEKKPEPEPEVDPIEQALLSAGKFDEAIRVVHGLVSLFEQLAALPGGGWLDGGRINELKARKDNLVAVLKDCKPAGRCPHCKGPGCRSCRDFGYVPSNILRSVPESEGG